MGDREQRDSRKVLEGKQILDVKRWRILDYILYPYRAYKEKKRQEAIRAQIMASVSPEQGYTGNTGDEWVYKPVPENELDSSNSENKAWIDEILNEDNKGDK